MLCGFLAHSLRARAREERGFALVEVLVSALLIATVAVGVFAGLDAAGNSSASTKSRGVAASIAQEDQERLRGLQMGDLIDRDNEVRTVTIGGVNYTVRTRVEAASDDGATTGCTSSNAGIDYFRVTSSVTWVGLGDRPPVAADTLIAPRAGSFAAGEGGLVAQVRDRAGQPLADHSVSISGAVSQTDSTDASGCAFFAYIPAGNYTMTLATPGFVTPAGLNNVVKNVTAPDGAISTTAFDYDRAGAIGATVKTLISGTTPTDDTGHSIVVQHSGIGAPGWRKFPDPPLATQALLITTPATLYPFTGPYAVWAGSCLAARPPVPEIVAAATVSPGATQPVTVEEPRLNILVRTVSGSSFVNSTGAAVWVNDPACDGTRFSPGFTVAGGRLPKPGIPYGRYTVCAEYNYGGSIGWRHNDENSTRSQNKANTLRTGVPNYTLDIGTPARPPTGTQPPTLPGQCAR